MLDNSEGKLHVNGIELALMRQLEAYGGSDFYESRECRLKEIFVLMNKKFDIKCKKGDKNVFKLQLDLPSIDDISWMPKNLTADDE